jgi:hypothetical protein
MRLQRQKPEKPSRARPLFGGEPGAAGMTRLVDANAFGGGK